MDLRQIVRRCVPCGLLLLAAGCTDPMLGLERPSAEPTLSLATRPAARPQSRAGRSGTPRMASAAPQPVPVGDIFKLYLVRDPSSVPTGPYSKVVALKRAEPARAIWLMEWLTEPSGQAGSKDRQFLVYADSAMFDWAADVAAMVDVQAASGKNGLGTRPAATMPRGVDPLAQAVSVLYDTGVPTEITRQTAEDLVRLLDGYCTQPGDPHRRWVACMLSARLQEDMLSRGKEAIISYDRAAQLAQPSSPAWLVARYHQANSLYASGRQAEARTTAQEIVKQSGQNYSRVRAYREAEKLAGGTR